MAESAERAERGERSEKVYGKKPTHVLKVKQRHGNRFASIGVGWLNDDGSTSISLNPCVVVSHLDDVIMTLFPIEEARP